MIQDHAEEEQDRTHQRVTWGRLVLKYWHDYNWEYAGERMRAPIVLVTSMPNMLGSWDAEQRLLRIAEEHIARDPWHEVLATLRHEMAHQFASEVLGANDEVAHGPAFQRACKVLRADPRATGGGGQRAEGAQVPSEPDERLMRRVSKLLALGGSPNEHEATSAVQKARALMLEHNLDVVTLDRARGFEMRVLGGVSRRRPAWERNLVGLLPEYFFVEVISCTSFDAATGVEGRAYHVYGTRANLAMAEYVFAYISSILPGLWQQHRAAHGITGDRDRLQFFEGVVAGFRKKLASEEAARIAQEHALVWRGDPRLEAFYRWHHPRIRTSYSGGRTRGEAFGAGVEAGGQVTLRRPLSSESGGFGGLISG
ncbi:MAG: DUF2786 domain-containing protein [Planctomycetota bacterium]